LLAQEVFVTLLQRAETEVRGAMEQRIRAWEASRSAGAGAGGGSDEERPSEHGAERDDAGGMGVDIGEDRPVVRVGAFCAMGKHRSVAFVHEAARRAWPREWEVRVEHRDVGAVKRSLGKARRRVKDRSVVKGGSEEDSGGAGE
jgi:hypothetical protein